MPESVGMRKKKAEGGQNNQVLLHISKLPTQLRSSVFLIKN